jgi:hypothetical protein
MHVALGTTAAASTSGGPARGRDQPCMGPQGTGMAVVPRSRRPLGAPPGGRIERGGDPCQLPHSRPEMPAARGAAVFAISIASTPAPSRRAVRPACALVTKSCRCRTSQQSLALHTEPSSMIDMPTCPEQRALSPAPLAAQDGCAGRPLDAQVRTAAQRCHVIRLRAAPAAADPSSGGCCLPIVSPRPRPNQPSRSCAPAGPAAGLPAARGRAWAGAGRSQVRALGLGGCPGHSRPVGRMHGLQSRRTPLSLSLSRSAAQPRSGLSSVLATLQEAQRAHQLRAQRQGVRPGGAPPCFPAPACRLLAPRDLLTWGCPCPRAPARPPLRPPHPVACQDAPQQDDASALQLV